MTKACALCDTACIPAIIADDWWFCTCSCGHVRGENKGIPYTFSLVNGFQRTDIETQEVQ